jgi:hypothetical protein
MTNYSERRQDGGCIVPRPVWMNPRFGLLNAHRSKLLVPRQTGDCDRRGWNLASTEGRAGC